jgi:hypothetical protein
MSEQRKLDKLNAPRLGKIIKEAMPGLRRSRRVDPQLNYATE